MENPATWGKAEHIVDGVLESHFEAMTSADLVTGPSLTRRITDALRAEGLLREEE
jgi:hypothetical protein